MIAKNELLAAMERECDLALHLYTRIPEDGREFRFTPAQRSTLELLRYISFAGLGFAQAVVTSDWSGYTEGEKAAEGMSFDEFPAAMERQKEGLRALFGDLTEDDLKTKTFTQPWGEEMPIGPAVLVLAYASLVAYRMQLFLQAKAAGNAALTTANNWGGIDMPEPQEQA